MFPDHLQRLGLSPTKPRPASGLIEHPLSPDSTAAAAATSSSAIAVEDLYSQSNKVVESVKLRDKERYCDSSSPS